MCFLHVHLWGEAEAHLNIQEFHFEMWHINLGKQIVVECSLNVLTEMINNLKNCDLLNSVKD